jgi:hypothetical protein
MTNLMQWVSLSHGLVVFGFSKALSRGWCSNSSLIVNVIRDGDDRMTKTRTGESLIAGMFFGRSGCTSTLNHESSIVLTELGSFRQLANGWRGTVEVDGTGLAVPSGVEVTLPADLAIDP